MGIKEFIQNLGGRKSESKERFKEAEDEDRIQSTIQERKKSANERELERYIKENREAQIKNTLEKFRKERQRDITFNHNILNTPNIIRAKYKLLKEPNQFKNNKNIFSGQKYIHKDNKKLLYNGGVLKW